MPFATVQQVADLADAINPRYRATPLMAVYAGLRWGELAVHLDRWAEPGPDGLVFPAPEGGPLRRSNFRRRVWVPATEAVGLDGLRFHDLRHTAATLAIAAGANTRDLMARMGHTSPASALRYQHAMPGRDAAIAAALDKLVSGPADPQPAPMRTVEPT
jgi:hypothetical protein